MSFAQNVYAEGRKQALRKFAGDHADQLVSTLGAMHPGAAAVGAGMTAPDGYGLGQAARTGAGAAAGATVGAPAGEAIGELLAHLFKKDPTLFKRIGGGLGKAVGGGVGAHAGHVWANDSMMNDMANKQMGG